LIEIISLEMNKASLISIIMQDRRDQIACLIVRILKF
jgi:hypothetical protein